MPVDPKAVIVPKLGNLTIHSASEVGDIWGINMLLYGVSGAGKTTLAASCEDSEYGRKVLYIDCEGGSMSVADRPDVFIFRPTTWQDILAAFKAIRDDPESAFKTIVVDSLTEAQQLAVRFILGNRPPESISQPDWQKINANLLEMTRAFRGLTHSRGINTIFTATERMTENAQTGAVKIGPNLTPQSSNSIQAAVDAVGYLTWNPKTGKRILHLDGDGQFVAKVRQPRTGKLLPRAMEDPSLGALLDSMKGGKPLPKPSA